MFVDKRLLKQIGFCFRNWMYPELFNGDEELQELAEKIGDYSRNYALRDYPTEKDFDDTLRKYMRDNHIEAEDENKFISEIKKNLKFKPWWR